MNRICCDFIRLILSKLSHFPQRISVLPPFYPQVWTNLDLPYILKSSFDCTFFFFDSHINLNHLLILNFCQISIRLKKSLSVAIFSYCLFVSFQKWPLQKSFKKLSNVLIRIFFFKKQKLRKFLRFLSLGQIKWNLCRSYK